MIAALGGARERRLAIIAWIVVCVVWGTTYVAIRVSLESIPVALLAGLRWAAAGVLMTAMLPFIGETLPPVRTWGSIAIAGFLMAVIGNGGVVWAEQYVASGLAAVVVAMNSRRVAGFGCMVVLFAVGGPDRQHHRTLNRTVCAISRLILCSLIPSQLIRIPPITPAPRPTADRLRPIATV